MERIIRHIDTSGLPEGFDVADLIESECTGELLIEWCKERVRDGAVPMPEKARPARATPEGEDAQRGPRATPEPTPKPRVERSADQGDRANVVALRKPAPEPEDSGLPPEYSDDAIADAFSARYHEGLVYVDAWQKWVMWDGRRWVRDATLAHHDLARSICRKFSQEAFQRPDLTPAKQRSIATALASARTMSNIERVARSDRRHAARTDQWDADPFALNTPDGIVDLRSGMMRPARKEDFCTRLTRVAPIDGCPKWIEFLKRVTNGDDELRAFMRRVAGYCLTGSVQEQVFFFVYGPGGNGKGTFMNTITWILDTYAASASTELFVEQKYKANDDSHMASLDGARLVTAQEIEEGKRWNETRMKQITGGDPINACFKYANPFTYQAQFKLLFAGNHKPQLRNVDDAIKRRLYLVPFDVRIPPAERDPMLQDKLRAEAGGILQWMIDGCLDWQRNTLAPPDRVLTTTREYFEQQDVLGQFFDERCVCGPNFKVRSDLLYREYQRWAESVGEFILPRKRFLESIAYKGMQPRKSNGVYVIDGIDLNPDREKVERPAASSKPHEDSDLF